MNAVLLDGVTSSTNSATIVPKHKTVGDTGVFQVHISDTATVTLQGRLESDAPWNPIVELTAADVDAATKSAARSVALMSEMRVVASISAGSVSAWLQE